MLPTVADAVEAVSLQCSRRCLTHTSVWLSKLALDATVVGAAGEEGGKSRDCQKRKDRGNTMTNNNNNNNKNNHTANSHSGDDEEHEEMKCAGSRVGPLERELPGDSRLATRIISLDDDVFPSPSGCYLPASHAAALQSARNDNNNNNKNEKGAASAAENEEQRQRSHNSSSFTAEEQRRLRHLHSIAVGLFQQSEFQHVVFLLSKAAEEFDNNETFSSGDRTKHTKDAKPQRRASATTSAARDFDNDDNINNNNAVSSSSASNTLLLPASLRTTRLPPLLQFLLIYALYKDGEKIKVAHFGNAAGSGGTGAVGGAVAAAAQMAGAGAGSAAGHGAVAGAATGAGAAAGAGAGMSAGGGTGGGAHHYSSSHNFARILNPHLRLLRELLEEALQNPHTSRSSALKDTTANSHNSNHHANTTTSTAGSTAAAASAGGVAAPRDLIDRDPYLCWLCGVVLQALGQGQASAAYLLAAVGANPLLHCAWEDLATLVHTEEQISELEDIFATLASDPAAPAAAPQQSPQVFSTPSTRARAGAQQEGAAADHLEDSGFRTVPEDNEIFGERNNNIGSHTLGNNNTNSTHRYTSGDGEGVGSASGGRLEPYFMVELFLANAKSSLGITPLTFEPLTDTPDGGRDGEHDENESNADKGAEGGTDGKQMVAATDNEELEQDPNNNNTGNTNSNNNNDNTNSIHRSNAARLISTYDYLLHLFPHNEYLTHQKAQHWYHHRRHETSAVSLPLFRALHQRNPYRLESAADYSNILFIHNDRRRLSLLAQKCYQVDPFSPATQFVMGNFYVLTRQHDKSIVMFKRCLALDPHMGPAWVLLGHAYVEVKNILLAITCYKNAAALDGKDTRAWYSLGQVYELLQNYHAALFYYWETVKIKPKDSRMWLAVSNCLERDNRTQEAIACLERAEEVESSSYALSASNNTESNNNSGGGGNGTGSSSSSSNCITSGPPATSYTAMVRKIATHYVDQHNFPRACVYLAKLVHHPNPAVARSVRASDRLFALPFLIQYHVLTAGQLAEMPARSSSFETSPFRPSGGGGSDRYGRLSGGGPVVATTADGNRHEAGFTSASPSLGRPSLHNPNSNNSVSYFYSTSPPMPRPSTGYNNNNNSSAGGDAGGVFSPSTPFAARGAYPASAISPYRHHTSNRNSSGGGGLGGGVSGIMFGATNTMNNNRAQALNHLRMAEEYVELLNALVNGSDNNINNNNNNTNNNNTTTNVTSAPNNSSNANAKNHTSGSEAAEATTLTNLSSIHRETTGLRPSHSHSPSQQQQQQQQQQPSFFTAHDSFANNLNSSSGNNTNNNNYNRGDVGGADFLEPEPGFPGADNRNNNNTTARPSVTKSPSPLFSNLDVDVARFGGNSQQQQQQHQNATISNNNGAPTGTNNNNNNNNNNNSSSNNNNDMANTNVAQFLGNQRSTQMSVFINKMRKDITTSKNIILNGSP